MTENYLDSLPRLNLISSLTNMPNLSGVDNNLSYQVDFNYYSIPNFQNNDSIGQLFSKNSSFSVLHSNVRS